MSDASVRANSVVGRIRPWDTLVAANSPDAYWHNSETDLLERGVRSLHFEVEEAEGFGGPFDVWDDRPVELNYAWWGEAQTVSGRWAA